MTTSTQTQHTDRNELCAPWSARQSPFAVYGTDTEEHWDVQGTWYEDDGSTSTVAVATVYDTSGRMARLAAAAPALLAALEDIESQARIVTEDDDEADELDPPTWEDYYEALREIAEKADAATRAARGEE